MPAHTSQKTERSSGGAVVVDRDPIIIATFPRSGTHLTIDLLRKQFAECRSWKLPGEPTNRLFFSVEATMRTRGVGRMSEAKALRVLRRAQRPIVKTHLVYDDTATGEFAPNEYVRRRWEPWLRERGAWIYIHRDPREVMSSYQLIRQRNHPTARCSFPEFIRQKVDGMNVVASWAWHARRYLMRDDVLPLSFRQVVKETEATLKTIGERIGLTPQFRQPLLPRRLNGVRELRFNWLFRTRPESTAQPGRHGNQQPVDWREALHRDDRRFFHEMAGDMLIDLGYEESEAWIDG